MDKVKKSVSDLRAVVFRSGSDRSSLLFSVFNTTNCIIGSGIIALPYASKKCGIGLVIVLTMISALISIYTNMLLIIACNITQSTSYTEVVSKTLGRWGKYCLTTCNILFPSFVAVAYGIAITDNLQFVFESAFPNIPILQRREILLACCLILVILPLSIFKHISFLEKVSMVSMIFVLFYTFVFLYKTPQMTQHVLLLPEYWTFMYPGFFQSLGTLFFAFSVQHNTISLYRSLNNHTYGRTLFVFTLSIFASLAIYNICLFSGFISFAGVLHSNMFKNYCQNDLLIMITQSIFIVTLLATYPFQLISARDASMQLLDKFIKPNSLTRILITVGLIITYGIISTLAKYIGPVIEIGGLLTASPLILIFPPLAYMKSRPDFVNRSFQGIILWTITILGCILMLVGTGFAIYDIISTIESDIPKYWCLT